MSFFLFSQELKSFDDCCPEPVNIFPVFYFLTAEWQPNINNSILTSDPLMKSVTLLIGYAQCSVQYLFSFTVALHPLGI